MDDTTPRLPSAPAGPAALGGGAWWVAGASALPGGVNTLVMAAGLLVGGYLWVAARRRGGQALPRPVRARLLRCALVGGGLVVAGVAGLGALGHHELACPVAALVTGGCLVAAAGPLVRPGITALGAGLLLLGLLGAALAPRSAGPLFPTVLVGLGAAALVWTAVAVELGLVTRPGAWLGDRVRR